MSETTIPAQDPVDVLVGRLRAHAEAHEYIANADPEQKQLTFEDALRIARGCTDYGGGHRGNAEHYEIYQHGIQTVINALTAASKTGLDDMQTMALHSMGANP